MTQEEVTLRLQDELHSSSGDASEDDGVVVRTDRTSVKEMIRRFERTSIINFSDSCESLERQKDPMLGSLTSIVNPIQVHFQHLSPQVNRPNDRSSIVSVNSVLSNLSEGSSSSGFVSDRKSGLDGFIVPHRPAPPPPTPPTDELQDRTLTEISTAVQKERRFSFTTPNTSPIVLRRVRQPPVIRRKSSAGRDQSSLDTHWSYGVTQTDLEKLLRLKRSESDTEEEGNRTSAEISISSTSSGSSNSTEELPEGEDYVVNSNDDGKTDTLSTDHSTDTLINEDGSDEGDNASEVSGESGRQSNYDNVSIKSISSFDMVPYQKYDSITVSSDEFGSEVCHAPETEFLTVSAVNEWVVSKSVDQGLIPTESKKEKYRRRLTERVNELLHTEKVYVERLKHVVDNYIPEMSRTDLSPTLQGLKTEIFANIEKICRFHAQEFLPALKECGSDLRKLGQCFRTFEKRFNMYVMYSRNNKRATALVYQHKLFFQEKQLELGDRLDLPSYLLEPVQRIPRYKLFLEDLVKTYANYENEKTESDSRISNISADSDETGGSNGESSDNEETPFESLKLAKIMIECVLTAVDGIMALENIRDCPHHLNLLHQGQLLRQNEFYAMDSARRRRQLMRIFLFDKLLLITTVYRKQLTVEFFIYKDHIPVDELGITAKEHDNYKFSIWYKKRNLKTYKLETRDPTIRNAWVDDITSLLWEQAMMRKKELLLQQRNKRDSIVSSNSQESTDADADADNDDKYNSLRGVPGEVRRGIDKKVRRTTWYCE